MTSGGINRRNFMQRSAAFAAASRFAGKSGRDISSANSRAVVASRGGSYAPGTPREPFEYVQNYLRAILDDMLALDVDFIVPELTSAPQNPAMSELIPLWEASRTKALEDAATKAKTLAERLAAA